MVKRFQGSTPIRQINFSTGAAQGLSNLGQVLDEFSRQQTKKQAAEIQQKSMRQGVEAGQALQKGEKPEFKKVGFFGSVAAKAHNQGLMTSYMAGIDRDNQETINQLEAENETNLIRFNEASQGYMQSVLQEVDPSARSVVSDSLQDMISTSRMRVQSKTIANQRKNAIADNETSIKFFADQANTESKQGNQEDAGKNLLKAFAVLDSMVESGDLTEQEASFRKREAERQTVENSLAGKILDGANDEVSVAAAFKELDSLSKNIPKGFTSEEWSTFVGSTQAELNQKRSRLAQANAVRTTEQSKEISNIKIKASTNTGDAGEIVKKTEKAFNEGLISESERTSIFTNLIKGQEKTISKAQEFNQVSERLNGEDSIVLTDDAISDYYDEMYLPAIDSADPLEVEAQKANYVMRMKRIPKAMKSELETFIQSDNPDLIVKAATLVDRIDSTPGLVERSISANDRAYIQKVTELLPNMDPVEAVDLARKLTNPDDKARINARKDFIKNEKLSNEYEAIVKDHFNPFGPFQGTGVDEITIDASVKEYKILFESLYEAGFSKDGAERKALSLLNRNWRKSEVTGKVMKYPLEDYYSVGESADYVMDQVVKDVNKNFFTEKPIKKEDIRFQAVEKTARTAASGNPEYGIIIIQDGNIVPLSQDVLWRPDRDAQIKKVNEEQQKRIEEERKLAEEKEGGIKLNLK